MVYMGMALWHSTSVPLWERTDEINHFRYIDFIATQHRLPSDADMASIPPDYRIFVQYDQPPLYYLLLSPLIILAGSPPLTQLYPNAAPLCPGLIFAHYYIDPTRFDWPLHGTALAAWLARLVTIAFGGAAVVATWWSARQVFGARSWFVIQCTAAFAVIPIGLNIVTWINNDAPLLLMGALALGMAARYQQTRRLEWVVLLLAVALLSSMFKLSGIVVFVTMISYLIILELHRFRSHIGWIGLVGLVLIVGYIGLNELQCGRVICRLYHYDGFTSWDTFWQSVTNPVLKTALVHFARTLATPYVNEAWLPPALLTGLVLVIMGIGFVNAARFVRDRRIVYPLLLVIGAVGLALLRAWWTQAGYFHARYIAIGLTALVFLIVLGWHRLDARLGWLPVGVFLFISLITPPTLYSPLFQLPPTYSALPDTAVRLTPPVHFQAGIEMDAYRTLSPGSVELFFRRQRPIAKSYYLRLDMLDNRFDQIASCSQTVGTGLLPPSVWPDQAWVGEVYNLPDWRSAAHIYATLYPLANSNPITNRPDVLRPDSQIVK